MRNVYLPVEHSEYDLVLASQVAERLECSALYVTWSPRGYERPQVEAAVRALPAGPAPAARPQPPHGLLTEILGTMAAFVAALFAPRPAPRAAA